ncbi:hypothetical protein [Aquabacterium sp.]|uniref:hypothetical protein n=1 Tax=Aquabacterium sp. TaxID=1872578 RepID=UPI004037F697
MSAPIGVAFTELDCINLMLSVIGEAPINSLDVSGLAEVALAKRIVTETLIEVQSRGWSWNTERNYVLPLDLSSQIILPENVLRVSAMDDECVDVVQRGNRLYDRIGHTFTMGRELRLYIVWALPFEDLPKEARLYISIRAARKFQKRLVSSDQLEQFTADDEGRALACLVDADAEAGDYNMLTDSYDIARILQR